MSRLKYVFGLIFAILFCCSLLMGQAASTGTIRGLVTDATGGVIPGIDIGIENQKTGESYTTLTNDSGVYQQTFLPPGVYTVTVSFSGFKTQSRSDVKISSQSTVRVDFALEVGDIGQTVTVEGSAVQTSSVTSDVSMTLSETQLAELPMHSRTFDFFVLQQPGVLLDRTDGYQSFAFNGSHLIGNNYLLDGTDATFIETPSSSTTGGFGGTVNTVSISTIAEIKTLTSNFSAEEGRASGGVVNIISKRGTDSYHGSVYYYHRNDALNANDFFSNKAGDPRPVTREHQGGFVLGGPIVSGKTFFFGGYEFVRIRRPRVFEIRVPTSGYLNRPDLSPAIRPTLDLYPAANQDIGDPNIGLHRVTASPPNSQDLYLLRIDHTFGDRDSAFFRYNLSDGNERQILSPCFLECDNFPRKGRTQQFTASWFHNFSPTLVNQARFGFNRTLVGFSDRERETTAGLGPYGLQFRSGGQTFGSIFSFGQGFVAPQDLDQYYDNVSWSKGRHSIKFGVDLRRVRANRRQGSSIGTAFFTNIEAMAANDVQQLQEGRRFQTAGLRHSSWAFYFQDDFTVNNKLTLNLGVRYEYNTPYQDNSSRTLQFGPCCKYDGGSLGTVQDLLDGSFQRIGGPLYPPDKNNVAPRLGFAYDLTGDSDMIIRGGVGMYYGLSNTPGIAVYNNLLYQYFLENTPRTISGLSFPLPDIDALPPQPNEAYYFYAGYGPAPFDMRENYAIHFNLAFEKQLTRNTLIEVGYVGNHNLHFADVNLGINTFDPLTGNFRIPEFTVPSLDASTGDVVGERKFYSYYYSGWVGFYEPTGRSRYDSLQAALTHRGPNFLVDFNYTWSHFIPNTYTAPYIGYYTASGDLTYANGVQNLEDRDGTNKGPHILDTRHAVVGNLVYEIPKLDRWGNALDHILTGWTVGSIFRFYSGKPFTPNTGSLVENSNLWWGYPIGRPNQLGPVKPDSYSSTDAMINNYFLPGAFGDPVQNPSTGLTLGNLGRNSVRAPGFAQIDLSLGKKSYVSWFGEGSFIEFRFDFFNIFNRTNFGEPEFDRSNPAFGTIRRTVQAFAGGHSREIQASLTINF